ARRRRHEGRAAPAAPAADLAWADVQPALDEEIAALPAIYRSVFVLCALEGQSKTEVAEQLGLPPGTVSSRLAAARRRLQGRLPRRGISRAALAGPSGARAALPPLTAGLARAAVGFRLGAAVEGVSAATLALARGWLAGSLAAPLKA